MSRRRLRRRVEKAERRAEPQSQPAVSLPRAAARVERLAYTRSQAAAALGVGRSTFDQRFLPLVETIDLPWGTRLIPVDELERLVAEHRKPAAGRAVPRRRGRRAQVGRDVVERVVAESRSGISLAEIARRLDADGVRPVHGGRRWWPSTVRSVLLRAN